MWSVEMIVSEVELEEVDMVFGKRSLRKKEELRTIDET